MVVLAGCAGPEGIDEVSSLVQSRTGNDVRLPHTELDQRDVDVRVASLLGRPLTPQSASQVALLKSRRLRATLEELNLSQADLLEASLPSNPTLVSSVRWPRGGGGANSEFELAGDALNWLLLPLRRKLALREYAAAKHRVSHEVLELVFEVKKAFYEVQAQSQFLRGLETAGKVSDISADVARRLHDAGNINSLELLQEQTATQQVALEMKRTRAELSVAREKLSRLLGLSTADSARWKAVGNLPSMPGSDPSLSRIEAIAVSQRQDLAAQRETVAALEQGYSLTQKMRFVPALNVGVNTERESDGARLTGPTLDVEVPIFNWGQGRVRRSKAGLSQARATYEALDLEVRSDVRTALAQVQAARGVHDHLAKTLLPQRQQILGETLLQYNAMQVSNFALLRAKEDEVRAQRDAVEALRDYWLARAELERAAGGSLTAKAEHAH